MTAVRRDLPFGVPALLAGLLLGLVGSFVDDALGTGTSAGMVQVLLWAVSALLVAGALVAIVRGRPNEPRAARTRVPHCHAPPAAAPPARRAAGTGY